MTLVIFRPLYDLYTTAISCIFNAAQYKEIIGNVSLNDAIFYEAKHAENRQEHK